MWMNFIFWNKNRISQRTNENDTQTKFKNISDELDVLNYSILSK